MSKGVTILTILFIASILLSLSATYYKYVILNDYEIFFTEAVTGDIEEDVEANDYLPFDETSAVQEQIYLEQESEQNNL